jgi:hypothetical protein
VVNHPLAGPVFSGPHQMPFTCAPDLPDIGPALDADCSRKTVVSYVYKSSIPPTPEELKAESKPGDPPKGYKVYDPSKPSPPDVAVITTTEGRKFRYIVRREKGTINRAIYEIAFLHEPGTPLPNPWLPTPGWNGRLVYSFGGGCNPGYSQGGIPNAMEDTFLSRGYAHAVSSLNVFGTTCDDVISAETMMMVKEHFIKQFGVPVHTIGYGGSGGSMAQLLIAQNYPGLLDGIIPSGTFPDYITLAPQASDCKLLAHYFEGSKLAWTDDQKTAIAGYASWGTCANNTPGATAWTKNLFPRETPFCGAPEALRYHPARNPHGVRCNVYDNEINVFGRDPQTGFARRPLDNVGVQYGLVAFNRGIISAEQFLEMNEKVGGFDIDSKFAPERMAGDPEGLRLAYNTGRVDSGSGGLASIPIIEIRGYNDFNNDVHDSVRSFVLRARLAAANGSAENQVILVFKPRNVLSPPVEELNQTLVPTMDQWLDNLAQDTSHRSPIEKIAAAKPAGLTDACWTEDGEKIVEKRIYDGEGRCNQLVPPHADPRIMAGESVAEDVLKCALKSVNPQDYAHPFTAEQWARLKTMFPQGVCDFSRPGVGQVSLGETWRSY